MKRYVGIAKKNHPGFSLLLFLSLLLVSCNANAPEAGTATASATSDAVAAATETPLPPDTPLPPSTNTPVPADTSLPEPTATNVGLRPLAASGMIAFVSISGPNLEEIFVMNADGSKQRNITNSSGRDFDPVWSPDGNKIAFVSLRTGDREIFVMNPDGSEVVNVSNHPGNDLDPAWSPDGRGIGIWSDQGAQPYILIDLSGNILEEWETPPDWYRLGRQFVNGPHPTLYLCKNHADETKMCGENGYFTNLAGDEGVSNSPWSSDNTRLVFHTNVNSTNNVNDIYVLSLDGSELIQLTDSPNDEKGAVWSPTWATIPLELSDLCLKYEDIEAEVPGFFLPEAGYNDRSLVDWSSTGIYYTHYGASDVLYYSANNAAHPYIPDQRGSELVIGCSLNEYADIWLAEHAIQVTTVADYYSIPSSEYCPNNTCYLQVMDNPIEYLPVAENQLPNPVYLVRYAKMLTGPNISLMTRYENIVLRLNIDPWANVLTTEESTELLVHLAERIIERVATTEVLHSAESPTLYCLLMRGRDGCLLETLAVQLRLQQLGYAQVGDADGIFGPMTEQAIKDFQTANNLRVDGTAGNDTWLKLYSADAAPWP